MTEKDMEQLLKELLEECDNEQFIDTIGTFKKDVYAGNEKKTKKHGLVITTPDGSWFFVTIEKVI